MTAATVNQVMEQRLTRGTPVIVAESFGKAKLRGKKQIVTSKGPVKCNRGGRCAGNWCPGLAVFVAPEKSTKRDKKMGWRGGTVKVCLTHLKDADGDLLVPPPLTLQGSGEHPAFPTDPKILPETPSRSGGSASSEVSWSDLAEADSARDYARLVLFARTLKTQNEALKSKVIEAQERLIEHLMD
jgi:hypothetical protein